MGRDVYRLAEPLHGRRFFYAEGLGKRSRRPVLPRDAHDIFPGLLLANVREKKIGVP